MPPLRFSGEGREAGALAGALTGVRDRVRARNVTAVLGPTNTGKTHFAIERMVAHSSGIIGLPLRLLAREVYGRVCEKVGTEHVALITGEEKIKPKGARYWVCTVEAMPRDLDVSFVAIDEIQLAADLDRGHVFTDRLLHRRGLHETLVIGASTMQRSIEKLLPGVTVVHRPRLSKLSFAGEKKLSRLPHRTAIVAFSAEEVYAIAELIRRQRGGAAVVLGALSPRTRNAQVEMYQNGDVDYLIATDAIGMGLNLDVDHVAFAGDRKFDGWQYRRLNPAELGQIAGRAGRHLKDGTFGTTGRCPGFDEDLVEALEDHRFDPLAVLQWRNSDLDFSTIEALQASLELFPHEPGLTRAPLGEDVMVLDIAARDEGVRRAAKTRADVARLWDTCQVPDYRKVSPAAHAEFALTLYGFVVRAGRVPDSWYAQQVAMFDRTEGDIDTLSARIAQVRTLTYIANRPDWLGDPEHWQGVTRQLEDRLSDALHERLAQRFVDRRTSVLMRRLRENAMLEAEITAQGDVLVEGQHVGQLHGFRFTPDPLAAGEAARTLNAAAMKALGGEIDTRADRFSAAVDESFALANDGTIRWLGDPVAKLTAGDKLLVPRARIVADEHLTGPALETVQRRLDLWLAQHIKKHLGPLMELETGEGLDGLVRGIAFQVAEALGVLERARVAEDMKTLDQAARATLRKLGLRFGAYHIYLPALVKPAPRALAAQLWALRHGGVETVKGLDEVPHLAASGRTSFQADQDVPKGLYRAAGFKVCGVRAVRVDILERLADLIRPAIAYRPGTTPGMPPSGTADNDGFVTTVQMTSLAGCSGEDLASILKALGYVLDRRSGPAITVPLLPAAPVEPLKPNVATPVEAHVDTTEPSAAGADGPGSEDVAASPAGSPSGAGDVCERSETPTAADTGETVAPDHPVESPLEESLPEPASAETGAIDPVAAPEVHPVSGSAQRDDTASEDLIAETAPNAAEPSQDQPTVPEDVDLEAPDEATAAPGPGSEHGSNEARADSDAAPPAEPTVPNSVDLAEPVEVSSAPVPKHGSNKARADSDAAPPAEPTVPNSVDLAEPVEVSSAPVPEPKHGSSEARADSDAAPAAEPTVPDAVDLAESVEASSAPVPEPEHGSNDAQAVSNTAPPTEAAVPAEPILIEVWRPHRTHHHAQRRPERGRPRQDQGRRPALAGEPAALTDRPGPGRRDDRRPEPRADDRGPSRRPDRQDRGAPNRDRGPAAAQAETGEARAPEGEAAVRNAGKPRFDGRRDGPRRNEQRGEGLRGDRQRGDAHRGDGQRREGGRGDGHRNDSNRPQQFSSERASPRERQPDPNSPFAKLMALKLELERGKKES